MKGIYKNLIIVLSLLFILSLFGLAYYLYIFPERVANTTQVISLNETALLKPVLLELYTFSAISMLLGLGAILLSLFARNEDTDTNVVYIEKFKEKKEQKSGDDKNAKETEVAETDEEVISIKRKLGKEKDAKKAAELALSLIAEKVEASQGAIYKATKQKGKNVISLYAAYAFVLPESQTIAYEFGDGLAGQVAKEKKMITVDEVPDGYIKVLSGLGDSNPSSLIICPVLKENKLLGVAEIASFKKFTKQQQVFVQKVLQLLSTSLNAEESA